MRNYAATLNAVITALNDAGYNAEAGKYGTMPQKAPSVWVYLEPGKVGRGADGQPISWTAELQMFVINSGSPGNMQTTIVDIMQQAIAVLSTAYNALQGNAPRYDDKPVSFDAWYGNMAVASAKLNCYFEV